MLILLGQICLKVAHFGRPEQFEHSANVALLRLSLQPVGEGDDERAVDELVALALRLLKYPVSLNHYTLSTLPSLRAYVSFPAAFPQHFSVKNPNHIGGLV